MTPDARQKYRNLGYDNVIWAKQKTEYFEYHWLRALAKFDVTSFPAILSGIGRQFKFCQYINCCNYQSFLDSLVEENILFAFAMHLSFCSYLCTFVLPI